MIRCVCGKWRKPDAEVFSGRAAGGESGGGVPVPGVGFTHTHTHTHTHTPLHASCERHQGTVTHLAQAVVILVVGVNI